MSYLNTASKLHIAFSTLVCIATTLSSPSSLLAEESDPLFTPLTSMTERCQIEPSIQSPPPKRASLSER